MSAVGDARKRLTPAPHQDPAVVELIEQAEARGYARGKADGYEHGRLDEYNATLGLLTGLAEMAENSEVPL